MKKVILILLFFCMVEAKAQFTLDHDFGPESVTYVKMASGDYYTNSSSSGVIKIHKASDYSLHKTITLPAPLNTDYNPASYPSFLVSENLLNADSKIEFLLGYKNPSNENRMYLMNEDGEAGI